MTQPTTLGHISQPEEEAAIESESQRWIAQSFAEVRLSGGRVSKLFTFQVRGVTTNTASLPFFDALPAWLGGKRRLAPLIFALLSEELPREQWCDRVLLDPFSGGGAVSLYAKAQGFHVVASDVAERSAVITRAPVANSTLRLRREDALGLFDAPAEYPRVAGRYVPAVFSQGQADWIDRALAVANRRGEPTRSLLLLVVIKLVLRLFPMSLPTASDAHRAATGDFDSISPRRLGHYLKARELLTPEGVWALAEEVNAGVFGGLGEARKGDAAEIIQSVPADVVYLDPPYPRTTGYDRTYAVLDTLLGDERPPSRAPGLDELLDAAAPAPFVVLSYGGPAATLDTLTAIVARHRPVRRALAIPYAHLRSVATEEKNAKNREYLILAGR